MPIRSDSELVAQVQGGDHGAYGELVKRYEQSVRAVALDVLGNRHDAEDAAQDAFVVAFHKLSRLRDRSKYGHWLLKITRRQALRCAKRRRQPLPLDRAAGRIEPSRNGRLDEPSRRLNRAVQRLPMQERLVVTLRYFDGHSVQQIADLTGRPLGTVTKQLSRAYTRLRAMLRERGDA